MFEVRIGALSLYFNVHVPRGCLRFPSPECFPLAAVPFILSLIPVLSPAGLDSFGVFSSLRFFFFFSPLAAFSVRSSGSRQF